MMNDKSGYEAIPDVETGHALPEPENNPKETYPDATDEEALLLGYLDAVIHLPNPTIQLPHIQAGQVEGSPTSYKDLLVAIQVSTLVFAGTAVAGLVVIVAGSPLAQLLFPYVAGVVAFVGIIPAIMARFASEFDAAFATIDKAETTMEGTVDAVTFKVTFFVDRIQEMLREVLEPIRPKIEKAQKAEAILKKIDDSIDIPDPSDMEEALDGCVDQVSEKMEAVKSLVNFRKLIPLCLRSKSNFTTLVIYPTLAILLTIQLVGVYTSSQMMGDDASKNGVDQAPSTRFLRGTQQYSADRQLGGSDVESWVTNEEDMADSWITSTFGDDTDWYPIWVSLQTYLTAVVNSLIVFSMTQASVVAGLLNISVIDRVNDDASRALDTTGANEVFDKYLSTNMLALRAKLLSLVKATIKIDKAMDGASALMDIAGTSPQIILDSVMGDGEVKEKRGSFLGLQWSPSKKN